MDIQLHNFRRQLCRSLSNPVGLPPSGGSAAKAMVQLLDVEFPVSFVDSKPARSNPLGDVLQQVKADVEKIPSELQPLVTSFFDIADYLTWYKRPAPDMPEVEEGHVNAELIGPRGLEVRDDIIVGVTLMRPGLTYPSHQHPPEEVYIVLSEGLWRQSRNAWQSPGLGGYVYNPSNIFHSMKSVETPLFALWCLNL